jgi:hypothetical protein
MSVSYFLDAYGTVADIIKQWQPSECITERDFEKSLANELQAKLKGKKIITQYGSGKQKVDIVVQDKVPIEIKKDIKSNAVLQRLIGQAEQYLVNWEYLVLVVCGEISPDYLTMLEDYAKTKTDFMGDNRIYVILKSND